MAFPSLRLKSRPVQLGKTELLEKSMAVAIRPELLQQLPAHERDQIDQVVKALSFGSGYVAPQKFKPTSTKAPRPQSASVVAARAHSVLGPSSAITPVDIAVALQQAGMDMVEPFSPGTPLQPYYGYGREPRKYDYRIARNTTTMVREDRIPFETLDQLYKSYDVAQICTRHAINTLRAMVRSMTFGPAPGCETYPAKEIAEVQKRLRRPDGRQFLPNWLAENMLELWKFDSNPIYRQRDKAGNVTKLKNVSAKTIAPMLDYYGEVPTEENAWAFSQFIMGVPWDELSWSDIIYAPFCPETDSPFGTPPLETILINANTDIRLQLFFLQFFTAGAVPEALAIAPEDMTSGDDIADFEEQYDTYFQGDQSERYGLRWLPNGTELVFYKPQMFDPDLAEYVMRRTVSSFLETPHNVGLTDSINRSTGATQMDVEEKILDVPLAGYYEYLLDSVIQEDWNLPVSIHFDVRVDRKDELQEAQARQIYWQMAALRSTDVRGKLGYPVDPREQMPLVIMDERLGIIPPSHVLAISGEIDNVTGMPKPGSVSPQPFQLPGGATAVPAAGPQGGQPPAGGAGPKVPDPTKSYPSSQPHPSNAATKEALPDGQVTEQRTPMAQPSGSAQGLGFPGYGVASQGSPAQGTGVLASPETSQRDLKAWRKQSMNRVKAGKIPRWFDTNSIGLERQNRIWNKLDGATSTEQVDYAFKSAMPIAAGIVVQAQDTGRVLMTQRTPDKHDDGEAYARWEFPGGRLDDGEQPFEAAWREFEEETGASLDNFDHVGNWTSPDGVYTGFVVTVPHEADLDLDPDPEEVSQAEWWSKSDLDDPKVRDKVTETLDRVTPMLKGWNDQPRDHVGRFSTHETLAWHGHHLHTDTIIDHYAPQVEAAMADVFAKKDITKALEAAYAHLEKAGTPTPSGRGSGLPPAQAAAVASVAPVAPVAAAPVVGAAGIAASGVAVGAGVAGVGAATVAGGGAALGALQGIGGLAAAIAILAAAPHALAKLRQVLTRLYGDAYMQGAHSAAQAAHGEMPPWTNAVPIPEDYWTHWEPGVGEEAAKIGGGSLSEILRQRDQWIKEITDTEIDRIGDSIRQSVGNGRPLSEARAAVDEIVHDAKRAWLIADTEYSRASTIARRETYQLNNVPYVGWLHQPGACAACMENASVSPIPLGAHWPSGSVPVHPRCRCVEIPVLEFQRRQS